MREGYSDWLRETVPTEATWRTKLAELRRIESYYGDLDQHFDADGLESVAAELEYTAVNKRNNEPNPSRIEIVGDVYNNLASYRSALRKYQKFREDSDAAHGTLSTYSAASEESAAAREIGFRYEKDLQTALVANLEQIERGLRLVDNGKERQVPSGRIDALCIDANDELVVIELKAVTAKREVLGQIAAYMADIQDETDRKPRGIIIAPEFDPKLLQGAKMISGLSLMTYGFSFTFRPASPIK